MAEEQKPPVAVRITRPYTSDTAFLEHEAEILTRTSVVLLGAQQRPQGVVLRFEIVLKSGESILRGEGRVVGYKESALGGEAGLTLRFTRLDSRSKTLVDRAAAMREARGRGSSMVPAAPVAAPSKPEIPPAAPSSASALEPVPDSVVALEPKQPSVPPRTRTGPPPLPPYARGSTDPEPAAATPPSSGNSDMEATQVDGSFKRARQAPSSPPPQGEPPAREAPVGPARVDSPAPAEKPARAEPSKPAAPRKPRAPAAPKAAVARAEAREAAPIERPADRDGLLSRLRTRAEALSPARIHEILSKPGA